MAQNNLSKAMYTHKKVKREEKIEENCFSCKFINSHKYLRQETPMTMTTTAYDLLKEGTKWLVKN